MPPRDSSDMDAFLRSVERRAYTTALVATRGKREDALDIVQDAMTAMFRSYAAHPVAEWGALFHRVLHSRINDWHRRRSLRARFFLPWFGGGTDADGEEQPATEFVDESIPAPDEAVHRARQQEKFMRALHALPLRQQQAFMLRAWEGLDTAQTAQAMGCSEGSVKTHMSRAMQVLREILQDGAREE